MSKWIIRCSGDQCVRRGRRTLIGLESDPRLEEAAGTMRRVLEPLEARNTEFHAAADAVTASAGTDRGASRSLEGATRELAMVLLSTARGHHDEEPYGSMFPDGYGRVVRLPAERAASSTAVILDKLASETDPRLTALRERLSSAREASVTAHGEYLAAVQARKEAFERLDLAKREFAKGILMARAQALTACPDRRLVRSIFLPVTLQSRTGAGDEPPEEVLAAAPAGASTSPVGGNGGSGAVGGNGGNRAVGGNGGGSAVGGNGGSSAVGGNGGSSAVGGNDGNGAVGGNGADGGNGAASATGPTGATGASSDPAETPVTSPREEAA